MLFFLEIVFHLSSIFANLLFNSAAIVEQVGNILRVIRLELVHLSLRFLTRFIIVLHPNLVLTPLLLQQLEVIPTVLLCSLVTLYLVHAPPLIPSTHLPQYLLNLVGRCLIRFLLACAAEALPIDGD